MTNEEAQTIIVKLPIYGDDCYSITEYKEAKAMAIKALETLEEFERAQIITGGRLNGRTYAYKCGLEDGKRKALEQQPSWISVKDRLPEDGEKVVVTLEDGDARTMTFYRLENDWWFETDEGWEYKAMARAWMPSYKESVEV